MLRATHYVADTHGYRTVEPQKPVEVYPVYGEGGHGVILQWDELYFPIGCGKFEGGARPEFPVLHLGDVRSNQKSNFLFCTTIYHFPYLLLLPIAEE